MSKYQRRSPKDTTRQAAGDGKANSINSNYNGRIYNGQMYSVDGLQMQPSAACQQRHKFLPATSRKSSGKATTRQRKQQQQQHMSKPQDAQPEQVHTAQSFQPQEQPQSPILQQQQQQQQQHQQLRQQQQLLQQQQLQLLHLEQLRQLHGSYWPFGNNGQLAATANPSPQFYNYGSIGYSSCDNFWPGYTMITPTDPNIRINATN